MSLTRAERIGMHCEICPLADRRWRGGVYGNPRDVACYGGGSLKSKIAFVGELPGAAEVVKGLPLTGPTGCWFDAALADAGLRRDDVYVTNAGLCQTRGQGSEVQTRDLPAFEACHDSLWHELWALVGNNIDVIVPMGTHALRSVLPGYGRGIKYARGYVFPWPWPIQDDVARAAWVVPTLHPSPKNMKGKGGAGLQVFVSDVAKAMRIAREGVKPEPYRRIIRPCLKDVIDFRAKGPRRLVFDVENRANGELVCIGFFDGETALCIPFLQKGGTRYWPPEEEKQVRDEVSAILTDPAWEKVAQNSIHDIDVSNRNDLGPVRGVVADTMLAHSACWPDQTHSLHHLGSLYGTRAPWKDAPVESLSTEEMD